MKLILLKPKGIVSDEAMAKLKINQDKLQMRLNKLVELVGDNKSSFLEEFDDGFNIDVNKLKD
tara:strand:+ start:265 stop:453 length:189 start_codon:yes stop_codon:yes gene_type:complete